MISANDLTPKWKAVFQLDMILFQKCYGSQLRFERDLLS
jgi:hypothetical protein